MLHYVIRIAALQEGACLRCLADRAGKREPRRDLKPAPAYSANVSKHMQRQEWTPSTRSSTSFSLQTPARPRRSTEFQRGEEPDQDEDAELIRAALERIPESERTKVCISQQRQSHSLQFPH